MKLNLKLPQEFLQKLSAKFTAMSRRNKIILVAAAALVLLSLIGGLVYYFFFSPTALSREKPAQEITFYKTLVINQGAYSRDGGAFSRATCTAEGQPRKPFGYFFSDDNTRLDIFCADAFMGGISLSFKSESGQSQLQELAMLEGDAGTYWDTRSWISRDEKTKKLAIHTVTLSSSLDELGKVNDCSVIHVFYEWDKTIKDFVKVEPTEEPEVPHFNPPIGVVPECLDEKGFWKGKE